MNIIQEAEQLINLLETGKTMNGQDYKRVYKELTGKNYNGGNCPPCLRTANFEMRVRIQKLKEEGNCLNCKKQTTINDTNNNVITNDNSNSDKTSKETVKQIAEELLDTMEQLKEMNVEDSKINEIINERAKDLEIEFSEDLIPKTKKVTKKKNK